MIEKEFSRTAYFEWPFIFAGETNITFRSRYYKNGAIGIELLFFDAANPKTLIPCYTGDDSSIYYWFFGSRSEAVKSIHDSMHGIGTGVGARNVVSEILDELLDWIFHLSEPEEMPDEPPPTGLEQQILKTVREGSPFLSELSVCPLRLERNEEVIRPITKEKE